MVKAVPKREATLTTFRQLKEQRYSITIFCAGRVRVLCSHNWQPSWDQMIQYFGQDFELTPENRRRFLRRFVCEKCGSRAQAVHIVPRSRYSETPWTYIWGAPAGVVSPEEQERRAQVSEANRIDAEWRKVAREREAQLAAAYKAQAKQINEIEKARQNGIFLIGPPSPHLHKKNRPPMKG